PAPTVATSDDLLGLRWLDGTAPALALGATLGLPWPRGQHRKDQAFHALDAQGKPLALQTWPLAWWPDGSLKWTAHALPAGVDAGTQPSIRPGKGAAAAGATVKVREEADFIEVDTGVIRCRLPRQGAKLIQGIERDGREVLGSCTLIAQTDDKPDAEQGAVTQTAFQSRIAQLTVEQTGPVRAVIKVDGQHRSAAGREWLPFSVRFYFYAGAESLRVMHTFVFDGDDQKDFLRGIGLRFDVPLRDALYDRHVRFAGESGGLWAEGVRNLTGLRRDPGAAVREAQLAGRATPPVAQWGTQVRQLQHRIPAWGDYSLSQLSADG
ncbi:exo-rhamnogalacturonan lyase family protein, partial [Roseateles sp. P5_E11]